MTFRSSLIVLLLALHPNAECCRDTCAALDMEYIGVRPQNGICICWDAKEHEKVFFWC